MLGLWQRDLKVNKLASLQQETIFAFRMEGLGLLHLLVVVVVIIGFSFLKFGLFRTFGKLWETWAFIFVYFPMTEL